MYYPAELAGLSPDEHFVDCGAFDGDSVRTFLARSGSSFRRATAVEPDPENCRRLRDFVSGLPADVAARVSVLQYAVGASRRTARFTATGTMASAVGGDGTSEVEVAPLDELLADDPPTYVKVDVEGADADAVRGARALIREHAPVLAVCLYHCREHLWEIPLLIRSLSDRYRLFLRRYCDDCWEQVCYAIPVKRLRP
jgi:FkbM family methyltransferase